jgi:DNA-binding transcriptional MocR family regulator
VEQLTTWGRHDPASARTQKSLGQLWDISQGSVSTALTQLTSLGYVVALPRAGGQPTQYVLSGVSRLIFG